MDILLRAIIFSFCNPKSLPVICLNHLSLLYLFIFFIARRRFTHPTKWVTVYKCKEQHKVFSGQIFPTKRWEKERMKTRHTQTSLKFPEHGHVPRRRHHFLDIFWAFHLIHYAARGIDLLASLLFLYKGQTFSAVLWVQCSQHHRFC